MSWLVFSGHAVYAVTANLVKSNVELQGRVPWKFWGHTLRVKNLVELSCGFGLELLGWDPWKNGNMLTLLGYF